MATRVKYKELLNKEWVMEKLKLMSPSDLAKEIGAPPSSVHWVISRYFTKEERERIKYERVHKDKI